MYAGTLRDDEGHALVMADGSGAAGSGGAGVYRLPEKAQAAADAQYARDVARVHGGGVVKLEDEYRSFLQVGLRGGAGGASQSGRQGGKAHRLAAGLGLKRAASGWGGRALAWVR